MERYLIEVPHESDKKSCLRAIEVFLSSGSHFLANADWGCRDGEHSAWLVMEADDREDARMVIPPAFRSGARLTRLSKFTMEQVQESLQVHD